jgi:hypothetical protein
VGCRSVALVSMVVVGWLAGTVESSGGQVAHSSVDILSPSYAKSIGFPKVREAPKKTAVTTEKGCSASDEVVYQDASEHVALISDALHCASGAAASGVLTAVRNQLVVDAAISVPKSLGGGAFATAANAPQYMVIWKAGTRVAITSLDVDLAVRTSTKRVQPLTGRQEAVLLRAAVQQNSLYG